MNVLPSQRFLIESGNPLEKWKKLLYYIQDIIITNVALKLGIKKTLATMNPDIAVRKCYDIRKINDHLVIWYIVDMRKKFKHLKNIDKKKYKKEINDFYNKLMAINGMPINKILLTLTKYIDEVYNATI